MRDSFEVVEVQSPLRALSRLTRESFAGLYVASEHLGDAFQIGKLLQNERILEGMPDGIVVLDSENTIIWGNGRLREWTERDNGHRLELLHGAGQPRDLGARLLPVPHGAGHRPGQQLDVALRRQPLFPGARRSGVRGRPGRRST